MTTTMMPCLSVLRVVLIWISVGGCLANELVQNQQHDQQPRLLQSTLDAVVGSWGSPSMPLPKCAGDCDFDSECDGNLKCFQRGYSEEIPGCVGDSSSKYGMDFCYDPSDIVVEDALATDGSQPVQVVTAIWDAPWTKLGICQGDCDYDSECEPGLRCFFRSGKEPMPGCTGLTDSHFSMDFCYNPNVGEDVVASPPPPVVAPSSPPVPVTIPVPSPVASPITFPAFAPIASPVTPVVPTTAPVVPPPVTPPPTNPPVSLPTNPPVPPTPPPPVPLPTNPPVASPVSLPTNPPGTPPVPTPTNPPVAPPVSPPTEPPVTPPVPTPTNPPVLPPDQPKVFIYFPPTTATVAPPPTSPPVTVPTPTIPPVPPPIDPVVDDDAITSDMTPGTNYLTIVGDFNGITDLKRCEGDCDGDNSCFGDFACYQKYSRDTSVPGCLGLGEGVKDYCIDPRDDPLELNSDTFYIKLFWREGYTWQEETVERKWCWQCEGSRCNVGDRMMISRCDDGNDEFNFIKQDNGIQIKVFDRDLCLEMDSSGARDLLVVEGCDASKMEQRFLPGTPGDGLSFDGDRFELRPVSKEGCFTQQHHPKEGEDIFLHDCVVARNDRTSFWNRYASR